VTAAATVEQGGGMFVPASRYSRPQRTSRATRIPGRVKKTNTSRTGVWRAGSPSEQCGCQRWRTRARLLIRRPLLQARGPTSTAPRLIESCIRPPGAPIADTQNGPSREPRAPDPPGGMVRRPARAGPGERSGPSLRLIAGHWPHASRAKTTGPGSGQRPGMAPDVKHRNKEPRTLSAKRENQPQRGLNQPAHRSSGRPATLCSQHGARQRVRAG